MNEKGTAAPCTVDCGLWTVHSKHRDCIMRKTKGRCVGSTDRTRVSLMLRLMLVQLSLHFAQVTNAVDAGRNKGAGTSRSLSRLGSVRTWHTST